MRDSDSDSPEWSDDDTILENRPETLNGNIFPMHNLETITKCEPFHITSRFIPSQGLTNSWDYMLTANGTQVSNSPIHCT